MGTIGQWGAIRFEVTSSTAMLFQDMKLTADCETEERTEDEQKYIAAKAGKPVQITMTIMLHAALGIDVRGTMLLLFHSSQRGLEDYFYCGGQKIFPFKMMLTKATLDSLQTAPSGNWISAKADVTLMQSEPAWITDEEYRPSSTGDYSGGGKKGWFSGLLTSAGIAAANAWISSKSKPNNTSDRISNVASISGTAKTTTSAVGGTKTSSIGKLSGLAGKIKQTAKK